MKHLFFIICLLFAVSGFSQSDTTKVFLKRRPTPVWEVKSDTIITGTGVVVPETMRANADLNMRKWPHVNYGGIADPYKYGTSFVFENNEPPQFRLVMYGQQIAIGMDSFILDSSSQYYVKRWPVKQSAGGVITAQGEGYAGYFDNTGISDLVNRTAYFEYRIKDTSNEPLFTAYVPLKKQITIDTMLAMFNHWPEPTQTTLKGLYQVNVAIMRQKEPAKKEEDILLDAMSETLDSLLKLIEK